MTEQEHNSFETCAWCEKQFFRNELTESRCLGGLVCEDCDADEGNKSLGERIERLKRRSKRAAEGKFIGNSIINVQKQ